MRSTNHKRVRIPFTVCAWYLDMQRVTRYDR